jgi:hypothetical protein
MSEDKRADVPTTDYSKWEGVNATEGHPGVWDAAALQNSPQQTPGNTVFHEHPHLEEAINRLAKAFENLCDEGIKQREWEQEQRKCP